MAETSGFFEARLNEETEEYDRLYYAEQFANYFKLFIGNGVFIQNSNQLQVESVAGMNIKVNPGWGFINGYWYNNSEELNITIPVNTFTVDRYDLVVLRKDLALREISIVYLENETNIRRDGNYYDLALAKIRIPVGSASISNSNITDKRPDEEVCGFVKGLVDIITTDALFNQFTAQFNEWFTDIKEKLEEDPAGNLQAQIGNLGELITVNKDNLVESINEVVDKLDNLSAEDIGLDKVDNTADKDKRVKYAESAGSATKATQDGNGNVIPNTYAKKSESLVSEKIIEMVDFNNFKSTGVYHIKTTSTINRPTDSQGTLVVEFDVGTPYQIWIPDYQNVVYKRIYSNGAWSAWSKMDAGNADSATKATQDSNGNVITKQYFIGKTMDSVDFNTMQTSGIYHMKGINDTNKPTAGNGTLIVEFDVGTPYQIWMQDSHYFMYKRIYSNGAWSAWTSLGSTKGIEFQIVDGELQYRYDTAVWG